MCSILIYTVFLLSTPIYEAIAEKESKMMESKGNCRINNTLFALNNNIKFIYFLDNNTSVLHVVAVDKNNKYYDMSNGLNHTGDFTKYCKKHNYSTLYKIILQNKDIIQDTECQNIKCLACKYYIHLFIWTRSITKLWKMNNIP